MYYIPLFQTLTTSMWNPISHSLLRLIRFGMCSLHCQGISSGWDSGVYGFRVPIQLPPMTCGCHIDLATLEQCQVSADCTDVCRPQVSGASCEQAACCISQVLVEVEGFRSPHPQRLVRITPYLFYIHPSCEHDRLLLCAQLTVHHHLSHSLNSWHPP